ncbi:hypothetical protein DXF97_32835 [Klebsiella pneumoniae]|nr:hypothetical protein DXF97_32835 [Klebsiella pneumoniae]
MVMIFLITSSSPLYNYGKLEILLLVLYPGKSQLLLLPITVVVIQQMIFLFMQAQEELRKLRVQLLHQT